MIREEIERTTGKRWTEILRDNARLFEVTLDGFFDEEVKLENFNMLRQDNTLHLLATDDSCGYVITGMFGKEEKYSSKMHDAARLYSSDEIKIEREVVDHLQRRAGFSWGRK